MGYASFLGTLCPLFYLRIDFLLLIRFFPGDGISVEIAAEHRPSCEPRGAFGAPDPLSKRQLPGPPPLPDLKRDQGRHMKYAKTQLWSPGPLRGVPRYRRMMEPNKPRRGPYGAVRWWFHRGPTAAPSTRPLSPRRETPRGQPRSCASR